VARALKPGETSPPPSRTVALTTAIWADGNTLQCHDFKGSGQTGVGSTPGVLVRMCNSWDTSNRAKVGRGTFLNGIASVLHIGG